MYAFLLSLLTGSTQRATVMSFLLFVLSRSPQSSPEQAAGPAASTRVDFRPSACSSLFLFPIDVLMNIITALACALYFSVLSLSLSSSSSGWCV